MKVSFIYAWVGELNTTLLYPLVFFNKTFLSSDVQESLHGQPCCIVCV